jgi:hypothetical protein
MSIRNPDEASHVPMTVSQPAKPANVIRAMGYRPVADYHLRYT